MPLESGEGTEKPPTAAALSEGVPALPTASLSAVGGGNRYPLPVAYAQGSVKTGSLTAEKAYTY